MIEVPTSQGVDIQLDGRGFERIYFALLAEGANEIPREVTDLETTAGDRVFLGLEVAASGLKIVREQRALLRPTPREPRVLSAVVTHLSLDEGGGVAVEHGHRYEEYQETGRYFVEAVTPMQTPGARELRFRPIANTALSLEVRRKERAKKVIF